MMRFPCYVSPNDPINSEWFNDVTPIIQDLQSKVMMLEATIRSMQVKCHCGNQALIGDYLCGEHRSQVDKEKYGNL